MTVDQFVKWVYPEARKTGQIHPLFVTSHAALESGWGRSAIGNNLFGITVGRSWTGKKKLVRTHEVFDTADRKFTEPEHVFQVVPIIVGSKRKYRYTVNRFFRDYDSLQECLTDHLRILQKPGYSDAWPYRSDPYLYAAKIVDGVGCKYATDPNYTNTMKSIIAMVEKSVRRQGL